MGSNRNIPLGISFHPIICRLCIIVFLMQQCICVSEAAQWEITPRIEISEGYDDNVRLAREGHEQADYITQVNPGISVIGDGRYTDVSIDYQMQNIFYKKNDEHDDSNHILMAASRTEVVKDNVFFDANVNYTQRIIHPEQTSGIDNISITDNRTDALTYTLSPYINHEFGNYAQLQVRYTHNRIDYKDDSLSNTDSETNTGYVEIHSGRAFNQFTWQLSHEKQVTGYTDRPDIESEDSQFLFRLLFSPKSYFVGQLGYEKYNYNTLSGLDNPEGSYWEAGLGWTPSHRTRIEYRQGAHYFGETERIEFNHRSRNSLWQANYSEEIVTTSVVEPVPGTIPAADEVAISPTYTTVPDVYLNKALSASVRKTTGKTDITLAVADGKRIFLDRETEERTSTITFRWDWQLAGRTRFSFDETYTKSRFSSTGNQIETKNYGIRLERRIRTHTTAYISHVNVKQEDNIEGVLYRRNYYSIGVIARY